jgi:uroporphyrinogen decarboxylase
MRQAGRYLPEYRAVRDKAGSFLGLCYNPELATEVTLQPIRRFDFDAAIVFADILVLPHAMGLDVRFEEGEGPQVETVSDEAGVDRLRQIGHSDQVSWVCETIGKVRTKLADEIALIGFCGAPWTVASYVVGGGRPEGRELARGIAHEFPPWFAKLVDLLVDASVDYLVAQIDAGAEAVQIFDSWAGDLPSYLQRKLVAEPVADIVHRVGVERPGIPVIVFARGVGVNHDMICTLTKSPCLGIETSLPLEWARDHLMPRCAVQGNLDPVALERGGAALRRGVEYIVRELPADRHVFNLGHGVRPSTPPEHVAQAIDLVRRFDEAGKP